jgi:hypothetical protein
VASARNFLVCREAEGGLILTLHQDAPQIDYKSDLYQLSYASFVL